MPRYREEIDQLKGWFRNRLADMPAFEMTEEHYSAGTDRLPDDYKELVSEALEHWMTNRKYELSYNQLNVAFFTAANELGKVTLVPRHPVFRLGSEVIIKEVKLRKSGETLHDVPGKITSVRGDDHVITLQVAVEDDRGVGNSCVIIKTDRLEECLALKTA